MAQANTKAGSEIGVGAKAGKGPLIQRRWEALIVVAIALLLIVIFPLILSNFRLGLLGRFLSLGIVALGIDLIWGFTGLLSSGPRHFLCDWGICDRHESTATKYS